MQLIKDYSWCKKYNIEHVKINIFPEMGFFTILDSFKIKRSKHMWDVLKTVRPHFKSKHSMLYQLCEWKTHNLLHALNIETDRTMHCDLNEDVSLYEQIAFVLISLFYFGY
jgi:hypothetical protein